MESRGKVVNNLLIGVVKGRVTGISRPNYELPTNNCHVSNLGMSRCQQVFHVVRVSLTDLSTSYYDIFSPEVTHTGSNITITLFI